MTPTKLYAVVDKDGEIMIAYPATQFHNQFSETLKELHTYDPATHGVYEKATQVVVDRELYEQHRKWTDNVAKGWDKFNYPHIEQFLSAGKG